MRTFFLSCVLLLLLALPAQAKLLSADQVREPQSLLPYCTWLPDPEMRHSIASVTSGASPERFAPLRGGLPLKGAGPVWVRLVLVKSSTSEMPLVINLGDLPPGKTTVYFAQSSGQLGETPGENWRSVDVSSHENIALPEPGLLPESVYIHMEEMPGLWFTPMVSAQNAAPSGMRLSAIILPIVLVLALGLCLLKGIKEQVQWALWAALYLFFALVSAVFTVPGAHHAFGFLSLPVLIAPGLALILLPHVGRCMFRTPGESLVQDTILYFCSFLGMVVALAPLFPGMGWLTRLFPLWPVVALPLLPLCLGAIVMKRPGALAYTGACLFPVLGAVASLAVMRSPAPHPFAAQGGLWGVALGGLGLVLARVPKYIPAVHDVEDEFMEPELAGLSLAESAVGSAKAKAAGSGLDLDETDAFRKHSQYEDMPPLQVQTLSGAAAGASSELSFGGFDGIRPAEAEDGPVLSGGGFGAEQAVSADAAVQHEEAAQDSLPGGPDGPDYRHDSGPAFAHAPDSAHDSTHAYTPDYSPEDAAAPAFDPAPAETPAYGEARTAANEDHTRAEEAGPQQGYAAPGAFEQEAAASGPAHERGVVDRFSQPAGQSLAGQTSQPYYAGEPAQQHDAGGELLSLVEEETPSFSLPPQAPSLGADILAEEDEALPAQTAFPTQTGFVFNLHALVRGVHDIVAPLAKNKGIIFSWFISPSLPSLLEGDAPRLRGALTLLLQNAVQATRHGSVQLAVRKNPGGTDRGDLLFAVSDSGSVQRTDAGFFHAWEMAARTGGVFNVEYSPSSGTQITFTVRFGLPSRQEALAAGLGASDALSATGAPTFRSPQDRDAEALARSAMQEAGRPERRPAQAEPAFAYPAEDPRLAAMTPEEVLAEEDFLEPAQAQRVAGAASAFAGQDAGQSDEHEAADESGTDAAPDFGPEAGPDSVPGSEADVQQASDQAFGQASVQTSGQAFAAREYLVGSPEARGGAKRAPRIAVAEMTTSNRRLLSSYLSDLPHEHLNAAGNDRVLEMARTSPLALIVFDGDMPEQDIVRTISALRKDESSSGKAPVPTLVLTAHESQSERMLEQGASYVLEKPYSQKSLRSLVALAVPELADAVRRSPGEDRASSALPGLPSGLLERHIAAVQAAAVNEAAALAPEKEEGPEASGQEPVDAPETPERAETAGAAETAEAPEVQITPEEQDGAGETAASAYQYGAEEPAAPEVAAAPEESAAPEEPAAPEESAAVSEEDEQGAYAEHAAEPAAEVEEPAAWAADFADPAQTDVQAEEQACEQVDESAGSEPAPFDAEHDLHADSAFADREEPQDSAPEYAPETVQEDAPEVIDGAQAAGAAADEEIGEAEPDFSDTALNALSDAPEEAHEPEYAPEEDHSVAATPAQPHETPEFFAAPEEAAPVEDAAEAARYSHPVEKMLADDLLFVPAAEEAAPEQPEAVFDASTVFATDDGAQAAFEEDMQEPASALPEAEMASEAFTDAVFAQPEAETAVQPEAEPEAETAVQPEAEPEAETAVQPEAEVPAPAPAPAPEVSPLASFDAFVTDVDPDALAEDAPDFGEVVFRDHTDDAASGPVAAVVHEDEQGLISGPRSTFAAEAGLFKETDVLEAALRGAPKQQGKAVEVSLPPRHGVSAKRPADSDGEAAPILQGLSREDVTPIAPAAASAAAPDSASGAASGDISGGTGESAHEGDGALLDYILPGEENEAAAENAARETRFPLPGIAGEFLNAADLPLTPGVIHSLQDALGDMNSGLAQEKSIIVQEAASRLAGKAENFGLDKLGKIARCVERAAQAGDMEAVGTLMDDLVPVVERYVNSLNDCFQSFLSLER